MLSIPAGIFNFTLYANLAFCSNAKVVAAAGAAPAIDISRSDPFASNFAPRSAARSLGVKALSQLYMEVALHLNFYKFFIFYLVAMPVAQIRDPTQIRACIRAFRHFI